MIIAGVGVSVATCDNHACASWKGLLQNGLQQCEDVCHTALDILSPYRDLLSASASESAIDALITVGSFITKTLNRKNEGAFGAWLTQSIGSIVVQDKSTILALGSLGVKIATTNYDEMIEKCTGYSSIMWMDAPSVAIFFRESTDEVLHLHGYYKQPQSVILGEGSYEEICKSEICQTALRSALFVGTVVFVGCGSGLDDPNFGTLFDWARKSLGQCQHSHYVLVRDADMAYWNDRLKGLLVSPIPYGPNYGDLAPFLANLASRVSHNQDRNPLSRLITSQADFDGNWSELEKNDKKLSPSEFIRQSKMLAEALWQAGGRRRAVTALSQRLNSKRDSIPVADVIQMSLDVAEWFLSEEWPDQAAEHLNKIQDQVETFEASSKAKVLFHKLCVQCMDSISDFKNTLIAIDTAILNTTGKEQEHFIAERAEIRFLRGEFRDDEGQST